MNFDETWCSNTFLSLLKEGAMNNQILKVEVKGAFAIYFFIYFFAMMW